MIKHFLQDTAQLLWRKVPSVARHFTDCILTMVALCNATSAKLQDFDQDIYLEFGTQQCWLIEKEYCLKHEVHEYFVPLVFYLSRNYRDPVDHPHLHWPALRRNKMGRQAWKIKIFKFAKFLEPAHCTMVPLSTRSCLKSNKLRPILNGQFCHTISKNIGLNVFGSKQPREILVFFYSQTLISPFTTTWSIRKSSCSNYWNILSSCSYY